MLCPFCPVPFALVRVLLRVFVSASALASAGKRPDGHEQHTVISVIINRGFKRFGIEIIERL